MKRKLPVIFAMTAFVAGTAIAEWPKIKVHEHSLAYNYPGSEYELIPHAGSDSSDGSGVDKTDSKNDESVETTDSNKQRDYGSTYK